MAGLAISGDNTLFHVYSGAGEFRRPTEDASRGIRCSEWLLPAAAAAAKSEERGANRKDAKDAKEELDKITGLTGCNKGQ
ncbi:MAG: hypothetical protein HWN51_04020 [Desulfobacterales bacterium]|nr:hypothetical protein [Desulfobacterales bacterium]